MAMSQAANLVEKIVGHDDNATITTDVSNYKNEHGVETGEPIKATTWQGKNAVKVVEMPKPRVVDPGDVIVKVTGSTICGSDLHLYHGVIPQLQKGDVLGHECCGIVDSVGPDAKNVKVGERVVVSFPIACGSCRYCKRGNTSQCEKTNQNTLTNAMYGKRTAGIFGYSHFTGGFAGGQAEYLRVPYGDVNLLSIPDEVPDEKALYISDVIATSWHCVVDTGVKKGDVVAIWGAGPIGQMCAQFSFYHGASRVIVIDGGSGAWRLDFVKTKAPKVETLDFTNLPKGESVTSQLQKMVEGGPDVALECAAGEYAKGWAHYFEQLLGMETDTSELLNEMITSVRPFGSVGVTGVYAGFTNHFNIGALMQTGVHLMGNGQAPVHKYWKQLMELIQKNEINPLDMVTHRVRLEDMDKLYAAFDRRDKGMQKVFVQTRHSAPPSAGAPQLTEL
ncbi:Alcohol dehydrogenase superfamily zinc-type [Penicillium bovifimosum]|uniref:Alcohol dehydrogenase superfamily zinc-type n=1 Tax=Penicillium bovifimosum TaxID=126998 RepID=A0A9W9HF35_9EURO|nr:Alcohol dehydrogenase superfamily zinc-type [Penicillium bovifimosum]KAJ5145874.1 Alcohol dehydrogenase superfamily zinc-type [Penicillium bovifimosum]